MQAIWKGSVSFGLVNVPVRMYAAIDDNDISLRMLHRETLEPIRYSRTCPKCEEEVDWSDIIKGYEYESGRFVTFDGEELDELAAEATRELKIREFVKLGEIDPVYFRKTYYLVPEASSRHAYSLLVEALTSTGHAGIAPITFRQKSHLAAIRALDGMLTLATLWYAEERIPREQLPGCAESEPVDRKELEMAKSIIEGLSVRFHPEEYVDEYRKRLFAAIEEKVETAEARRAAAEQAAEEAAEASGEEASSTRVISLLEALQASLQEMNAGHASDRGGSRGGAGGQAAGSAVKRGTAKTHSKRTGA